MDYLDRMREYYYKNSHMVASPLSSDLGLRHLAPMFFHDCRIDFKGKRILDLGCGSGRIADLLFELGASDYTGVDLVGDRFVCGTGKKFIEAPLEELGNVRLASDFDCILMIDVLEHLSDPATVLKHAHALLKNRGLIFTSGPNYLNVAGVIKILIESLGIYEQDSWAPFSGWQRQEHEVWMNAWNQRCLLSEAGFKITKHIGWDIVSAFLPAFYRKNGLSLTGPWFEVYKRVDLFSYRHLQNLSKWCSMFAIVVGSKVHETQPE